MPTAPCLSALALRAGNPEGGGIRAGALGYIVPQLRNAPLAQCFFVSPVLDMEALILSMMDSAQVTEERLQTEKEIATAQGVLSWEYLQYVRAHTVKSWPHATRILYAEKDHLVPRASMEAFAARHHCSLTCMPGGEHWFHTPEQLKFLSDWYQENLEE